MGMEQRGNKLYYYRKKRVGSKVISIYCGKGKQAEEAYAQDLRTREARAERNSVLLKLRELNFDGDRIVNMFDEMVQTMTNTTLEARGYRMQRGEWRKKQHG